MAWKDNKALAGILAVLAILAIGYAVYKFMPQPVDKELKCDKCSVVYTAKVAPSGKFPVACEKCKAPNAYPALKLACTNENCADKKKPIVFADKDEKSLDQKCPTCGQPVMPWAEASKPK